MILYQKTTCSIFQLLFKKLNVIFLVPLLLASIQFRMRLSCITNNYLSCIALIFIAQLFLFHQVQKSFAITKLTVVTSTNILASSTLIIFYNVRMAKPRVKAVFLATCFLGKIATNVFIRTRVRPLYATYKQT